MTAAETESVACADRAIALLVFEIDAHRIAVHLARVRQIARAVAITPLPGAPAVVDGVVDIHGRLVPVLDLRSRFGLAGRPVALSEHLVIASTDDRLVALRSDRALDVLHLSPGDIEAIDRAVADTEYVAGIAKLADGLILIHDLDSFLSEVEAIAIDDALAAVEPVGGEP